MRIYAKCPKYFIFSSHRSFSNDDGSSRQEVGAPDAIRGSYSFVSPEGEEVQVWRSAQSEDEKTLMQLELQESLQTKLSVTYDLCGQVSQFHIYS